MIEVVAQNGKTLGRMTGMASNNFRRGLAMDDESKCPVSGKRKYGTEGEALATAAHQIATANAPKDLRAYRCSWCDGWHLTKNAGRSGRDRG
jgi:hypothetical protein